MRRGKAATTRAAVARAAGPLVPAVAAAIAAWVPRTNLDAEHVAFCRRAVGSISPPTPHAARVYLTALGKLVVWCLKECIPVDEAHVFSPATYERWFRSLKAMTDNSRSSYPCRVRALAYVHCPHLQPPAPSIGKKAASTKAPYSERDIARWLTCARAQATDHQRQRLTALICLGAGAGCSATDMRSVTKDHLFRHESVALVVRVEGPRARLVPVLPRYADRLQETAARYEAGQILIGGVVSDRANLNYHTLNRIKGGRDLPPLEVGRLRATWWRDVLSATGYAAVMAGSGVRLAPPPEILRHLPTPTLEDVIEVCGGAP